MVSCHDGYSTHVLAVVLFIGEQIGGAIVYRKMRCNETFSKRIRLCIVALV